MIVATDLCPRCGHAWGMHCVPAQPRKYLIEEGFEVVVPSPCSQRGPNGRDPFPCGCTEPPPYARKTSAEMDAEIRRRLAELPPMTEDQKAAQRDSWARGEAALHEVEHCRRCGAEKYMGQHPTCTCGDVP